MTRKAAKILCIQRALWQPWARAYTRTDARACSQSHTLAWWVPDVRALFARPLAADGGINHAWPAWARPAPGLDLRAGFATRH